MFPPSTRPDTSIETRTHRATTASAYGCSARGEPSRWVDPALDLPPVFDPSLYEKLYWDLAGTPAPLLRAHYDRYGASEGRRSHRLADREQFAGLIPEGAAALEIGPAFSPLLRGPHVAYFDLRDRAWWEAHVPSGTILEHPVPDIDFVSPEGDLGRVDRAFDCILSSHVIEHQPDLVAHLRAVEQRLVPGGCYFVLAPDKRYCCDHFMPESDISGVLEAHVEGRQRHTLRNVLFNRTQTAHNDSNRHWKGDHGAEPETSREQLQNVLTEVERAGGRYIDVHAWFFRPATFRSILRALRELELIRLEVIRLYPTLRGGNEFWAILRRPVR